MLTGVGGGRAIFERLQTELRQCNVRFRHGACLELCFGTLYQGRSLVRLWFRMAICVILLSSHALAYRVTRQGATKNYDGWDA
ncbi:hypothetical protein NDU88_009717 [Pleurodeles waltl]|uniref:Uncharacterized protein n=1 Tax=Pleurodeles waltl TaxID=8319 RepID=A0AAV7PWL6_PLEWA|nr:hypothetical protein NDU88_009717 [Pleurodeles waltl]